MRMQLTVSLKFGVSQGFSDEVLELCNQLIHFHVIWIGFLPTLKDVFLHALVFSRIYVSLNSDKRSIENTSHDYH